MSASSQRLFFVNQHPASAVHTADDHSYIYPVKWDDFISNLNAYLDRAAQINGNINDYQITKTNLNTSGIFQPRTANEIRQTLDAFRRRYKMQI